jgi:hypothetical protein
MLGYLVRRKEWCSVEKPEPPMCEISLRLLSEVICLLAGAGLEGHAVTRELVSIIREVGNVGSSKGSRAADLDRE